MMGALRASEALAKFGAALPENIPKFDDAQVGKITALLDSFRKKDPDAVPFALALVAGRLKTPRELMHLATKAARSRNAADVAATPYAIAISMVLDQIDDKRIALLIALRKNRVIIARDVLADINRTEAALRAGIREFDASEWGTRLREIRDAIAAACGGRSEPLSGPTRPYPGIAQLARQRLAGRPDREGPRCDQRRRHLLQTADRPGLKTPRTHGIGRPAAAGLTCAKVAASVARGWVI